MGPDLVSTLQNQVRILEEQNRNLGTLRTLMAEQNRMLEVLGRIGLREILVDVDTVIQSRQMTTMETMVAIQSGKSIARWGDGELKLMLQPEFELPFQRSSAALAEDLKWMLRDYDRNADELILALPTLFTSRLWMGIWAENWHLLRPILTASKHRWGNTHVSRPVFFQRHGNDAVDAWRKVWDGRRVCVVAGRGSRFELIPELFDNALDIRRIDSEPIHAYSRIEELKSVLAPLKSDVDVYLIALGPTGTVLAGYLSSEAGGNCQAIDIGHLSASYANVFRKTGDPESLPLVAK